MGSAWDHQCFITVWLTELKDRQPWAWYLCKKKKKSALHHCLKSILPYLDPWYLSFDMASLTMTGASNTPFVLCGVSSIPFSKFLMTFQLWAKQQLTECTLV